MGMRKNIRQGTGNATVTQLNEHAYDLTLKLADTLYSVCCQKSQSAIRASSMQCYVG